MEEAGPPPSKLPRTSRAGQIKHIYENGIPSSDTRFLSWYARAFEMVSDDEQQRDVLYRLLMHVEKYMGLFEDIKTGRFLVPNLVCAVRRHKQWLRPIEEWFPKTKSRDGRFSDMIRHLFAKYEVPRFFDRIWFMDPRASKTRHYQEWYIHIANGGNIRSVPDFPAYLTKRMAHLFLQAPAHSRMEHAIRRAQVLALGGRLRRGQSRHPDKTGRGHRE